MIIREYIYWIGKMALFAVKYLFEDLYCSAISIYREFTVPDNFYDLWFFLHIWIGKLTWNRWWN